ncbi:hypothetical protein BGZ82_000503 [Podila clonocystis]|nr:hypothetical protein BGZ82_000503 [Podila clonocystis]
MSKEQEPEATKAMDANQDVQPPPPSYAVTSAGNSSYAPPAGPPPSNTGNTYYQAQPVGGQTYAPPGGYASPSGYPPQKVYAAPEGAPGGYAPPAGVRPNTVIYVVDNDPVTDAGVTGPPSTGCPMAMICFIFGLCTWVGYLVGMCFINSPDPRERLWAKACGIMAIIWALIIIFCSIFAR